MEQVKHGSWSFLQKKVNSLWPENIFAEKFHLRCLQGS